MRTLTIFFPDISSYELGLTIQPGTVAVIAKATEGTYYRDAEYANFKAQAAKVGAVFSAYHFLKADGNSAGQADYCHAMVGGTPVMLDVETEGASMPTVADIAAFIARMRTLGARVWGAYVPRWYWEQVGGDLGSLGVVIVSSNYTTYSDAGPGWVPYGGAAPALWQYTNAQPYGGQAVDFNAYRGTVTELAALINDTTTTIGEDVALSPEDIQAVAAAVYNYGREDITVNGQVMHNAPLGQMVHGTWTALNDPAGAVPQMRGQVNELFHRPIFQPVDVPALAAAIAPHLAAGATAEQVAEAVVAHLATTLAKG